MEALSFTQIIIIIISLTFGIIAIKIAVKFDLNKYLERRDNKLRYKIQNTCLHMELTPDGEGLRYTSFFESPLGIKHWHCSVCGVVRYRVDDTQEKNIAQYYLVNPTEYKKQKKNFNKLLKKLGVL